MNPPLIFSTFSPPFLSLKMQVLVPLVPFFKGNADTRKPLKTLVGQVGFEPTAGRL